jgi:hypothetical protein
LLLILAGQGKLEPEEIGEPIAEDDHARVEGDDDPAAVL